MSIHTSRFSPEWIVAVAVGFAAGITSTILTGWAPLSDVGRAIIFLGSSLSGASLAYWSSRASSMGAAFGKSTVSGAVQANVSATALLYAAFKVDAALQTSPRPSPPSDPGALALIMLVAGSVVGLLIGVAYSFIPTFVAYLRKRPSIATTDRAMFATALWLAAVAVVHSSIVRDWAAWAPLALLSSALAVTALVRTAIRRAFLARVRAGREPRYRIEPSAGRSVLYRVADEDERETFYRENATPPPPPEAVGVI